MKRIITLTLAALLLAVSFASALPILSDDFESGLTDWRIGTNNLNGGSGDVALVTDPASSLTSVTNQVAKFSLTGTGIVDPITNKPIASTISLYQNFILEANVLTMRIQFDYMINDANIVAGDLFRDVVRVDTVTGPGIPKYDAIPYIHNIRFLTKVGTISNNLWGTASADVELAALRNAGLLDTTDARLIFTLRNLDIGTSFAYLDNVSLVATTVVPEPSTLLLLGSGLFGLAWYGRKRRQA